MAFEFNNPQFSPRNGDLPPIGPHSFKTGTAYEQHKKVVEGVLAGLKIKEQDISDIMRLWSHAKQQMNFVRQHAENIDKIVKEKGHDHNRQALAEEIQGRYLERFRDYTKDELLMILTMQLTLLTVEEIV
jgi:hypothetical protein